MKSDWSAFKIIRYILVALFFLCGLLSLIFNNRIYVALGLLVAAVAGAAEMYSINQDKRLYPGLMGNMERWYGRKYVTMFFSVLVVILLLLAIVELLSTVG